MAKSREMARQMARTVVSWDSVGARLEPTVSSVCALEGLELL